MGERPLVDENSPTGKGLKLAEQLVRDTAGPQEAYSVMAIAWLCAMAYGSIGESRGPVNASKVDEDVALAKKLLESLKPEVVKLIDVLLSEARKANAN